MKSLLNKLFENHTLSRQQAREVLTQIASQAFNQSSVAAFLTVFRMRCITVPELMGFRDAMLDLCEAVDLSDFDPIDLCGTGGDGKDTFNISTISALVVAGAGIPVAKHGNRGVSSICGSSNVLQHLGVPFCDKPDALRRCLEETNFCYLHAPLFHPAMKHIAPIRQELGVRTFFNMLGPLVNPSRPSRQLIGVFSLELARLYAYLLQQTPVQYNVVHSLDGYDEISLTGAFKLHSPQGESLLHPRDLQLESTTPTQLHGGDSVASAAKIFLNVLQHNGTPAQHNVVLANAGLAIQCAKPALSTLDAIEAARESLVSGRAYQTLKTLLELEV